MIELFLIFILHVLQPTQGTHKFETEEWAMYPSGHKETHESS